MAAHAFHDFRFARSLPAREVELRTSPLSRLGLKAAASTDRRMTGTPFDAITA